MVSGEWCDPRIEKSFPQSRRDAERGTEVEPREGLRAATDSSNLSARGFGNTGGLPPRPRSADTPPNQGGELLEPAPRRGAFRACIKEGASRKI